MVSRTRRKPTLLPSGTLDYLRRRGLEVLGLSLILSATAIVLALISYSPQDPSFNNATNVASSNWLGEPGGYMADILISFFGIVATLPALALMGWGWRLIRRHSFDLGWLRLAGIPFLMLTSTATLTSLSLPAVWIQPVTYGGVVGELLLHYQTTICASLTFPMWPITLALGVITLAAMPLVLGVPKQDVQALALNLWRGLHWVSLKIVRSFCTVTGRITFSPRLVTERKPLRNA